MLNRREFLASALFAALLRPGALSAAPVAADEVFLNRLTFGATPAEREALAALGRAGWLDAQLALPARIPEMDARLANQTLRIAYEAGDDGEGQSWPGVDEARPLSSLYADPASLLPLVDWEVGMDYAERARPGDEVIAAALTRAVHTPAQLREVMTQFWHDHFNVHAQKDEYVAIYFPSYDATLREHALGNFRSLLGAMAKSPAMLHYLNNDESRASPANENFAREILELHTLGAPNYLNAQFPRWDQVPQGPDGVAVGYIDEDVYEVARALTGWGIGDGHWISEGVEADRSGLFYYTEAWHDPYQKRILGVEFPPNRAALADGEQVLDMLARHPGTARFVCTKLARRLLADEPEAGLVDRLVQVFLAQTEAPDQIAQVVRTLALDPAFDTPPTKIRRPFEFMAAIYRASGAKVGGRENSYHWQLARAGWLQHTFPPPTGHPDEAAAWMGGTVLLRLVDYALYAHEDWFDVTTSRLSAQVPDDLRTIGDLVAFWATRVQGSADDRMEEVLAEIGASPDDPLPEDEQGLHDLSTVALAFAALSPRFLFR